MASVSRLFTRSRIGQVSGFSCIRRFSDAVSHPSNRVQIYVSRSRDPCLNLSIEHYLLQKSTPESVVLFLYTNRPCVVIGRNQNPWLEVNLGLLNRPGLLAPFTSLGASRGAGRDQVEAGSADSKDEGVQLVRRRSGGGTVFHDEGNVNYSVICPPAAFDRNTHAEMVVRALRSLGVETARVNERHDIVVDAAGGGSVAPDTFKISGSAYKLTRLRSLHHGTCLLSTPNLDRIGQFLHSPAAPYIKARGVESVRSKITNVGVENRAFEDAVVAEFGSMYGNIEAETISEIEAEEVSDIVEGYKELNVSPPLLTVPMGFVLTGNCAVG
jgi:lipoate-protein ligase A